MTKATRSNNGQTVQFIHESVREFLLKGHGLDQILTNFESISKGQSNEKLKQCCFKYMNVDILSHIIDIRKPFPKASSQKAVRLRKSASNEFPFLEYAVRNVLYHADSAEDNGVMQRSFIQTFPLDYWIKLDNLYQKHEVRRHTPNASFL